QPIQKMVPPVRCICKALGAHLAAAGDAHVERILGNVDTQYSVGHCLILPSRLCGTSSASSNLVRRIYALARPRIPSSLNSGAWKNGASSTAQAHSPKGRKRLTVLLAAQQTCLFTKQPATYKGREFHLAPAAHLRCPIFRGSISHPMQLLCTLRNRCRQQPRNTRYQAGATPYLSRTFTGWTAPASAGALTRSPRRRVRAARAAPRGRAPSRIQIDD